jgi:type IX secretion system PorP/SprF family membrane protein
MKKLIPALFALCVFNNIQAQDADYGQPLNTHTNTNPAMVGVDSTLLVSLATRFYIDNSANYSGVNFRFAAEQYLHAIRGGIGFDVATHNEDKGKMIDNIYRLHYAPRFELFKKRLTLQVGLSAAFITNYIDWSRVTFGYPYPTFVYTYPTKPLESQINNWSFSTGIFAYTKNVYGGVGVFHLNTPDVGLITVSELPIKTTANVGANLNFNKASKHNFIISPNVIYKQQQDFRILAFGVNAKYRFIVAGFSYTNRDNINAKVGFQNRFLKVDYSMNITSSGLTNATGFAHEIHLIGYINYQKKEKQQKSIRFI